MSPALRRHALRVAFFTLLAVIWQALSSWGIWDPLLFPSPLRVWEALLRGFGSGQYPGAIGASLGRLLWGYALSLTGGIPLGLVLGRVRILDDTLGALALGLQALPSICWLPLAVLWFGLGEQAMLFVVVMGSLMAVTLSVRDGVRTIPPILLDASLILGATRWKSYMHVVLPASLPSVLSGGKVGWTFAWRSLLAAELLYVDRGLGTTLWVGRELHDMPLVVATMLVIVALGLLADRLFFGSLERQVQKRWGILPC